MHVCQNVSCLSFQTVTVKLPLTLACMSPCFNFSVFLSRPLDIHSVLFDSPTKVNTSCVLVMKYFWKEEEIIHVKCMTYPFFSSSQTSYCHMCSCHRLCYILPLCSQVYIQIICIAICVTDFVSFYTEAFMFPLNILFERNCPFEENNNFIHV